MIKAKTENTKFGSRNVLCISFESVRVVKRKKGGKQAKESDIMQLSTPQRERGKNKHSINSCIYPLLSAAMS